MKKSGKKPAPFPSKQQIIEFIGDQIKGAALRNILIGFGLSQKNRAALKDVLKELEQEGRIKKGRSKRYTLAGRLPPVGVIQVTGTDENGDVVAEPLNWRDNHEGEPPLIFLQPEKQSKRRQAAMGIGDRALARLTPLEENSYQASIIKRIGGGADSDRTQQTVIGIYRKGDRLEPTDRRYRYDFEVPPKDAGGARPGDLVVAEISSGRRRGRTRARIIELLDKGDDSLSVNQSFTRIALHAHDIPYIFSEQAMAQAEKAEGASLGDREDLRQIPLVTIDGADARDFDDAVFAEPDDDPDNEGGWRLIVAIADVAWYVRPGDALDREAYERGNSVYFPDQVVPMLPEALSNGWCSLRPDEDRPCLIAHIQIDAQGNMLSHQFQRALMRSRARLTYEQAQSAKDGAPDAITRGLMEEVINPLYGAYYALCRSRDKREPLDLDLPEKKIVLDDNGEVEEISLRHRLDSHRLIEEFMITANVAAAETLGKAKLPAIYRHHDEPPAKNLENFRTYLHGTDITLAKGQVLLPRNFNQILRQAKKKDLSEAISQMVLRSQSQAIYSDSDDGHFGLALRHYCHFTSPIRRYSDLIVHRALITALKLTEGGLADADLDTAPIAEHISITERRAVAAEREVIDRYAAAYLATKVGESFTGRISGVTKFGVFVTLDKLSIDGLVPVRSLPGDRYHFNEKHHQLKGARNGLRFSVGDPVDLVLSDANALTGSLIFEIAGANKF